MTHETHPGGFGPLRAHGGEVLSREALRAKAAAEAAKKQGEEVAEAVSAPVPEGDSRAADKPDLPVMSDIYPGARNGLTPLPGTANPEN